MNKTIGFLAAVLVALIGLNVFLRMKTGDINDKLAKLESAVTSGPKHKKGECLLVTMEKGDEFTFTRQDMVRVDEVGKEKYKLSNYYYSQTRGGWTTHAMVVNHSFLDEYVTPVSNILECPEEVERW